MSNATVDDGTLRLGPRDVLIGSRPGALPSDVCWGFGYGKYTTNDVQALTITGGVPTSGTVQLSFGGSTSAAIPYNEFGHGNTTNPGLYETLLQMPSFGGGQASVAGGPWPYLPLTVSFGGQYAGQSQAAIVVSNSSLNNGASVAVSHVVTGGLQEVYLVVIQPGGSGSSTLWAVTNPNNDAWQTTTWTQVTTGLDSSPWWFQQYQDKVYAANKNTGLAWYQLGGGSTAWSAPAGISGVPSPGQPKLSLGSQPGALATSIYASQAYSGWGTNPTATNNTLGYLYTLGAVLNTQQVQITYTLNSTTDWSKQDYWQVRFQLPPNGFTILPGSITFQMISTYQTNGSNTTVSPDQADGGAYSGSLGTGTSNSGVSSQPIDGVTGSYIGARGFYFGESTELYRKTVTKLVVTMQVTGPKGGSFGVSIFPGDVWMNDSTSSLAIGAGPVQKQITYAYSYLKASNGAETQLLYPGQSNVLPSNPPFGNYVSIQGVYSTTLTSSDFVKVYRLDQGGIYRLISIFPNNPSASPNSWTLVDALMEDECEAQPAYGLIHMPGGYNPEGLSSWKGSLIALAQGKVWYSYVGKPNVFAPDPSQYGQLAIVATSDPNGPRTVYMDNSRSDQILGVVPQDAVLLAGYKNAYAMVNGSAPLELNAPLSMPGSRGALGYRSCAQLSGGMMVAADSGLWYYSVSNYFTGQPNTGTLDEEELTKEIRTTWDNFVNPITQPENAVAIKWLEEIWVFNGANYIRKTRNGHWEQGTLDHSIFAAIANDYNGLLCATTTGSLISIGLPYSGQDGWSWTSGLIELPRSVLDSFEIFYTGTPSVTYTFYDGLNLVGTKEFDLTDGKVLHYPASHHALPYGWRVQFTVTGGPTDIVSSINMNFTSIGGGKNN